MPVATGQGQFGLRRRHGDLHGALSAEKIRHRAYWAFFSVSLLRGANQRRSMIKHHEEFAEQFFSGNGATYDQIASFSTLGLDGWWKRKILNKIPKTSNQIIEQASGTGILTCKIARLLPECRIIGVELHEEYVNIARKKARDLQLTNVEFIHGRAEEVILDGEFDCIASAYLAKYVDLDLLVAHARKMLREGGVLITHELTRPTNSLFVGLWKMHFKFLQTYGKWKHAEWEIAFRDLPLLLTKTQWVDELTHALRANKFLDIKVEHLFFGASVIVSARK
jgi:demethylmenaquinone methyltransferase/2-methoxy-6-polyprenyl-1,4-benzoquinol methylase